MASKIKLEEVLKDIAKTYDVLHFFELIFEASNVVYESAEEILAETDTEIALYDITKDMVLNDSTEEMVLNDSTEEAVYIAEDIVESGPEDIEESGPEDIVESGPEDIEESGSEDIEESGSEDMEEIGTEDMEENGSEEDFYEKPDVILKKLQGSIATDESLMCMATKLFEIISDVYKKVGCKFEDRSEKIKRDIFDLFKRENYKYENFEDIKSCLKHILKCTKRFTFSSGVFFGGNMLPDPIEVLVSHITAYYRWIINNGLDMFFQLQFSENLTEEDKKDISLLLIDSVIPIQHYVCGMYFQWRFGITTHLLRERSALQFMIEYSQYSETYSLKLEDSNIKKDAEMFDRLLWINSMEKYKSVRGREVEELSYVPESHIWWFKYTQIS